MYIMKGKRKLKNDMVTCLFIFHQQLNGIHSFGEQKHYTYKRRVPRFCFHVVHCLSEFLYYKKFNSEGSNNVRKLQFEWIFVVQSCTDTWFWVWDKWYNSYEMFVSKFRGDQTLHILLLISSTF